MESEAKSTRAMRKIVRQQMEFYFGDANLNKDNFMRQAIAASPDGYIQLADFLKFNRIQKLTQDVHFLAKSLRKSKELELNEDKTAVRRVTPMKDIENVDDRTVYVEFLPIDASHEWLTRVFSVCGKVVYVSLPRYRTSGHIKQFAFVEYQTPEEAQFACHKLNNPPVDAPEKAGKFPMWNKTLYSLTQRVNSVTAEDDPINGDKTSRKRHLVDNDDEETCTKKMKRGSESSEDSSDEDSDVKSDVLEHDLPQLRVIPKSEWLMLKSQYIKLQKSNMVKLKKALNKAHRNSEEKHGGTDVDSKEEIAPRPEDKPAKTKGPEYIPNVIVKVESTSPLTKQQLKDDNSSKCNIAYVEILGGETVAYIRCKDAFSADMITKSEREGHTYTLLQGEEEASYWKKLANDRSVKFSKSHLKKKIKPKTKNTKIVFE